MVSMYVIYDVKNLSGLYKRPYSFIGYYGPEGVYVVHMSRVDCFYAEAAPLVLAPSVSYIMVSMLASG